MSARCWISEALSRSSYWGSNSLSPDRISHGAHPIRCRRVPWMSFPFPSQVSEGRSFRRSFTLRPPAISHFQPALHVNADRNINYYQDGIWLISQRHSRRAVMFLHAFFFFFSSLCKNVLTVHRMKGFAILYPVPFNLSRFLSPKATLFHDKHQEMFPALEFAKFPHSSSYLNTQIV